MLMQLFEHRDRYCFPTLSFIYFFNNILTFSIEKYNESRIPLIDTSRYPITYTTETYCYTQPIPTTMQFNQQQSLNIHNIESVPVTSPPSPLSSLSNSSNIFRVSCEMVVFLHLLYIFLQKVFIKIAVKLILLIRFFS